MTRRIRYLVQNKREIIVVKTVKKTFGVILLPLPPLHLSPQQAHICRERAVSKQTAGDFV